MKINSMEKFIEKLNCDVYPITIAKFLLNKRKILSYFSKAADKDFEIRGVKYSIDPSTCEVCKQKEPEGILCRQHTSINRVLTADVIAFDLDTNTCFYKNEIFRFIGNRLVIVYCPHPKLIVDEITDSKVRKINPITIDYPEDKEIPKYKHHEFLSSDLLDQHMKCWFNDQFSLVTIPEDRNFSNWCLFPNK